MKSYDELKREINKAVPISERIKHSADIPDEKKAESEDKYVMNEYAEGYKSVVELLCPLDMESFNSNVEIALSAESEYDRIVILEPLAFACVNIAYIEAMLASDYKDFRQFMINALVEELHREEMSPAEKNSYRKTTRDATLNNSTNIMKTGISFFEKSIVENLLSTAVNSFQELFKTYPADKFSRNVKRMTETDRFMMTTIFSNFAYLLRIINNDAKFLNDLNKYVTDFKHEMG